MKLHFLLTVLGFILLLVVSPVLGEEPNAPVPHPAQPMPADEKPGDRPYEMVRAKRQPPHVPLVNFDSLTGWQVECTGGAVADLFGSQKQRVWESPVARLVYRGTSNQSTVVLRPPAPIADPRPRVGDNPLGLRQQLVLGARAGDAASHHHAVAPRQG